MTDKQSTKDLVALFGMLETATAEVRAADSAENEARRAHTEARNRLNDVQKQIDDALTALAKAAPSGSNWHSLVTRNKRGFVTVGELFGERVR